MVTIKEEVEVLEGEFCVSCACFSAILVEKNFTLLPAYILRIVVFASINYQKRLM